MAAALALPSTDLNLSKLVRSSITLVLKDEGFSIPSAPAKRARRGAEIVLEWSDSNKVAWDLFSAKLFSDLNNCFESHTKLGKIKKQREKMWEKYHKLRSSESFTTRWTTVLTQAKCEYAGPIFYQYVTDSVMAEVIKLRFPVSEVSLPEEVSIDDIEKKGLRYTVGSVIRSLKKKVARSGHIKKKELGFVFGRNERGRQGK